MPIITTLSDDVATIDIYSPTPRPPAPRGSEWHDIGAYGLTERRQHQADVTADGAASRAPGLPVAVLAPHRLGDGRVDEASAAGIHGPAEAYSGRPLWVEAGRCYALCRSGVDGLRDGEGSVRLQDGLRFIRAAGAVCTLPDGSPPTRRWADVEALGYDPATGAWQGALWCWEAGVLRPLEDVCAEDRARHISWRHEQERERDLRAWARGIDMLREDRRRDDLADARRITTPR